MNNATIKEIKSHHRCMMEDMVLDGLTAGEVCDKYGMTPARFSIVRRSPLWRIQEAELRKEHLSDRRKEMESLIPSAIKALRVGVEKDPGSMVSLTASKEILNRAGMPANLVVEHEDKLESSALYETLEDIQERKKQILEEMGVNSVDDLVEMKPISGESTE